MPRSKSFSREIFFNLSVLGSGRNGQYDLVDRRGSNVCRDGFFRLGRVNHSRQYARDVDAEHERFDVRRD